MRAGVELIIDRARSLKQSKYKIKEAQVGVKAPGALRAPLISYIMVTSNYSDMIRTIDLQC